MGKLIGECVRRASDAARSFEARWTLRSLRRVDPDLYARLVGQQELWDDALFRGDEGDIRDQTEAMCRGWLAVARRMEEVGASHDAFLVGRDERTGLRVVIADQQACQDRVGQLQALADKDGNTAAARAIFVTPDEVATLLAAQQDLLRIKGAFPGCEIVDLYPTEPKVDVA